MSAPRLLLFDEPSLGLAPAVLEHVFEAIVEIAKSGVAVCLVEQDVYLSLKVADYAYVLENGVVASQGPAKELLQSDQVRASYLGL
jgi:branched-chain amino acid transport system ATP-binding protein